MVILGRVGHIDCFLDGAWDGRMFWINCVLQLADP